MEEHSAVVERWLPVVDFEGYYEVSNLGRVRSLDRRIPHGGGRGLRRIKGRILAQKVDEEGRRQVDLWVENVGHTRRVHNLVLTAFVGSRPPGLNGLHNNGDPADNGVLNLRWDTQSENLYDEVRHGTHRQSSKVRCPYKHLLREPNLVRYFATRGRRSCLACDRARGLARKARQYGRAYDMNAFRAQCYEKIMGTLDA